MLGHAGEGTFLTADEQVALIRNLVNEVSVPIIAGITGEGTKVAVEEAQRAVDAGATAGLVYPSHGWLRFGYQQGAPQDRYRAIYEETGLPLILFQYPDNTKANYNLDTQLEIAAQPGVFATKNGVRNMRRWDTEIPVLRRENPDLQILSCHDEYLLHTMFDVDGLLVGYGGLAPEPLIELIAAGKAKRLRRRPQGARPPAAGHQGRLPPRLAHGGHRRAQDRPAHPRHPAQRRRALAAGRPHARGRGRDRRRHQERRPRLTALAPGPPTQVETRLAQPVRAGWARRAGGTHEWPQAPLPSARRRAPPPAAARSGDTAVPDELRSPECAAEGEERADMSTSYAGGPAATANAQLVARLERIPVTRRLLLIRIIIGSATFFDAYTVLVIAFAMPSLVEEWSLTPAWVGFILSAGYLGQLIGAILFGWVAEKIGRLPTLLITIVLFVSMDVACLFAWSGASMLVFRFFQGIGTGGEVPVASAYINEFIGAKKRGRFFLLYELIFPIGLLFAGLAGYFLVPLYGWRALFIVGLVPAVLMIPMRIFMPESPRWLASKGRIEKADKVVSMLEREAVKEGKTAARARRPPGRPQGHRDAPTGANCSRASTSSAP